MGKDSRIRARKAQKKLKAKLAEVEKEALPQTVAIHETIPEIDNHQEDSNYRLIFDKYNHTECEIHLFNKPGTTKSFINKLGQITKNNPRTLPGSRLIRDHILNLGSYQSLFRGIPEDVELVEIELSGGGRIMCFFLDNVQRGDKTSSYCCIVAALATHR